MDQRSYSALQGVAHLDAADQRHVHRRRRVGYVATTVALTAVMGVAVLDGLDVVDAFGVDDGHAVDTADGLTLDVRYPTVSRPALASPFEITVRQDGGFAGQSIEVVVSSDYLRLWDLNGVSPSPAEETADGEHVVWTFDPPDGDVLHITYEGRIEPAAQDGEPGRVAVLDAQGAEAVAVDFETHLRP